MDISTKPKIVPAILSTKIEDYLDQSKVLNNFAPMIHIDIMDGKFVNTKSPDALTVLNSIESTNTLPLSVHLMVSDPEINLEEISFFKNVKLVYIHAEVYRKEFFLKRLDCELGLVLDPDTNITEEILELIKVMPVIQIMTIKPGLQGQAFIPSTLNRIEELRSTLNFKGEIHIDGHVNSETIDEILKHTPNVLNVGSAISKSDNPQAAYEELLQKI